MNDVPVILADGDDVVRSALCLVLGFSDVDVSLATESLQVAINRAGTDRVVLVVDGPQLGDDPARVGGLLTSHPEVHLVVLCAAGCVLAERDQVQHPRLAVADKANADDIVAAVRSCQAAVLAG